MEILWRHISKTKRAISHKFRIRNAFMGIMTRAKFHFNRLMLTLIFGVWASELPPRAWRATEKAGPDRVNIHSFSDEWKWQNVPLTDCDFHTKWGKRDTFSFFFQKRGFQYFISEILRALSLLGETFTFFNSFGTTKISKSLRLSVNINVVLLINFPEQFESCFYFKYSKSYKIYNLGDKTFETDC